MSWNDSCSTVNNFFFSRTRNVIPPPKNLETDTRLPKVSTGRSEPILVGGIAQLKATLRFMSDASVSRSFSLAGRSDLPFHPIVGERLASE